MYVRKGSVTAGEFEHRSSPTSDQNSLVNSHRPFLAIISYSVLNVSSLCALRKIKSWLRHCAEGGTMWGVGLLVR